MNCPGAEVGIALSVRAELSAQTFELTAPHVGEIHSRWSTGCSLVEINRNLQLGSNTFAELARERDAIFHRRIFERHEWHHVGCANARVFAGVLTKIDTRCGFFDACERRFDRALDRHYERYY